MNPTHLIFFHLLIELTLKYACHWTVRKTDEKRKIDKNKTEKSEVEKEGKK